MRLQWPVGCGLCAHAQNTLPVCRLRPVCTCAKALSNETSRLAQPQRPALRACMHACSGQQHRRRLDGATHCPDWDAACGLQRRGTNELPGGSVKHTGTRGSKGWSTVGGAGGAVQCGAVGGGKEDASAVRGKALAGQAGGRQRGEALPAAQRGRVSAVIRGWGRATAAQAGGAGRAGGLPRRALPRGVRKRTGPKCGVSGQRHSSKTGGGGCRLGGW